MGSSPRVRGTLKNHCTTPISAGIIPACAGNTSWRCGWTCRDGDHPRVCGEHRRSAWRSAVGGGSSPRVRGTPRRHERGEPRHGIIPACAGNTSRSARRPRHPRDHPRVCGEHLRMRNNLSGDSGSSPRVRGTLLVMGRVNILRGIIPACAGNTLSLSLSR